MSRIKLVAEPAALDVDLDRTAVLALKERTAGGTYPWREFLPQRHRIGIGGRGCRRMYLATVD